MKTKKRKHKLHTQTQRKGTKDPVFLYLSYMSEAVLPITGDMTIEEIMEVHPLAADVLAEWGLGCAMCNIGAIETLEEGAMAHGFTPDEIEDIITELNETMEKE